MKPYDKGHADYDLHRKRLNNINASGLSRFDKKLLTRRSRKIMKADCAGMQTTTKPATSQQ